LTNSRASITLAVNTENITSFSSSRTARTIQEVDTQKAFITVWDTRIAGETNSNQLNLSLIGGDFNIDWAMVLAMEI